MREISVLM